MPSKYALPDIARDFALRRFPERGELMKEFQKQMEHPAVKLLAAEIGEAAVSKNCNPMQLLGLGILYGCCLGALCEKYRRRSVSEP